MSGNGATSGGDPTGGGLVDAVPETVIETEVPPLELVGVHAAYGGIEVLHGIDLAVAAGEVVALLGANGAGKSTTVKVCSGLLPPTRGAVRVVGHDVTGVPSHELARIGVCTIPEGRGVFPNLTVRENLWMATQVTGERAELEEAAYARFPRLGDRRTQLAGTLSGGEQQMLALARALVTDPAVLLLDELSMGLAPIIVQQLYEIVAQVASDGISILVVEQFAQAVLGIADRAVIMVNGEITRVGTPAEMQSELSNAYLGG
ncbi:MAG: ABC transporter ATP-binding protein [Acidimicrobiales bacterium]|nr:ABC transporter ATP-binding protein [Acidimicrobiales bacterium]